MRSVRFLAGLAFAASPLLATVLTTGCATPNTQVTSVSTLDVVNEAENQRRLVVTAQLRQQTQLQEIGFQLLKAARPLCGTRVGPMLGMRLGSIDMFPKEYRDAARSAGMHDAVTVTAMAAGTAADRAGLKVGDRIMAVGDKEIGTGANGLKVFGREIEQGKKVGSLRFGVSRDGVASEISVVPDTTCAFGLVWYRSDDVNAFADGQNIHIPTGMFRFVHDDNELAAVIAHEIAHNAMGHLDAKKRNALLGGLLGLAGDIAMASAGVNTGGEYTARGMEAGGQVFSQDFEREADYVGQYILALAGRPLDGGLGFWRRMAEAEPGAIKYGTSHPTTPERFVRLQRAGEEIEAKRKSGETLVPNLREKKK